MKKALSFDDVLLVPKFSDLNSRKDADIGSELDSNHKFRLPVISSPMDTVTEATMARAMYKAGGLGIIHRYNDYAGQMRIFAEADVPAAVAIGMNGDFLQRAEAAVEFGCTILCVDVAHGHHSMMETCLKTLKDKFGSNVHLMAGNVATRTGLDALASWGADSVRVGIGGGSICSTRLVSGHGVPTFASLLDCSQTEHDVKIIADGGIKTTGDMVKAYAAGADFVMVGSMLAGTKESPGDVFKNTDGKQYKVYRGMASSAAQNDWRGKSSTPEGISTTISYKGSVEKILRDVEGGIKSGLSYSGVKNLKDLHAKSEFVIQTAAGQAESFTHILVRNK
jgi:IMP dehydrogenase